VKETKIKKEPNGPKREGNLEMIAGKGRRNAERREKGVNLPPQHGGLVRSLDEELVKGGVSQQIVEGKSLHNGHKVSKAIEDAPGGLRLKWEGGR